MLAANTKLALRLAIWKRASSSVASVSADSDPPRSFNAREIIRRQLECKTKVPAKKSWSATAVLERLDGTVESSVVKGYEMLDSPHFHRDRTNKLAHQQKGRETAEYAINSMREVFAHEWGSSTEAAAFLPSPPPPPSHQHDDVTAVTDDVEMEDSSDAVAELIKRDKMHAAVGMYQRMSRDKPELITPAITNQLLAYVVFYMGTPHNKSLMEEHPVNMFMTGFKKLRYDEKTVDKVFNSIREPTPDHYSVYLRSLNKMQRHADAVEVYMKHLREEPVLPVHTVEAVMEARALSRLRSEIPPYKLFQELYGKLGEQLPSYSMLPRVAQVSTAGFAQQTTDHFARSCDKLFNEIHHLGMDVTPSVVLQLMTSAWRSSSSSNPPTKSRTDDDVTDNTTAKSSKGEEMQDWLLDRLGDLQVVSHTPQDADAYQKIMHRFGARGDLQRAKKFYQLATTGARGRKVFKNVHLEEEFFSNYLSLVCKLDTIENLWTTRCKLVPTKTRFLVKHIRMFFDSIERNQAYQFLPLVLADMLSERNINDLAIRWFELALENFDELDADTKTQIKHIAIANSNYYGFIVRRDRDVNNEAVRERLLNEGIRLLVRNGEYQHVRNSLQSILHHELTLTKEAYEDLKNFALTNPRLNDILRRVNVEESKEDEERTSGN